MERIQFIDFLKGIGIILVVYGHVESPFSQFIFMFHMPLFFLLSGIFYKQIPFKTIIIKKTNQLIIPMIFFYLVGYIVQMILYLWDFKTLNNFDFLLFFQLFEGKSMLIANVYVWFLLALFWVTLFYCFILKWIRKTEIRDLLILFIFLLNIYMKNRGVNIPYFIGSSFFGLFFFHIGNRIGKSSFFMTKTKWDFIITVFSFLICAVFSSIHLVSCDMRINSINGSVFFFLIECLSMICGLFFLSKRINYEKFINFWGINSLIILGTHGIIITFFRRVIMKFFFVEANYIFGFLEFVFTLIISIPVILFLNKYLPQLVGQKSLIKSIEKR
jgi:fucose 4-O-acetylase-like acetyltransferase